MITVKEKIRLIEACFGKSKLSGDNKNVVVFFLFVSLKEKISLN